jgi:hypothetical protein
MAKKKGKPFGCDLPAGKEPYVASSLELLKDDACLAWIDTYAIRFHDATKRGPHFDYTIGNKDDDACIDFIIPKALTPSQVKDKIPNLPGSKPMLVLFQPVHEILYLTAEIGKVYTIPEGKYGAGKWWMVKRGEAFIERSEHGFKLWLDGVGYIIFKVSGQQRYLMRRVTE